MGLILLRSQSGISLIGQVARRSQLWQFLSDAGVVACYGLLSLVLMRKHVSWKSFAAGYLLLAGLFFLVAPSALYFLSSVVKVGALERSASQFAGFSFLLPVSILVLAVGGFFLLLLLSLMGWGVVVLAALLSTWLQGTTAIHQTAPGGTLLLPFINLPPESVLALIIVLVVHEGAHAIMARIARIPVLSTGLVLFGVIPIGAFVEPDEKKLRKLERTPQTRVLVAGSTANLITAVLFFALFLAFAGMVNVLNLTAIASLLPVLRSVSLTLGLTFALNFIVGTVNLLPIPLFDGYRTLEVNIAHKPVLHFIAALTVVAFLLNLVPWLFA